uniref:Cytochrome b n=1 Tax=Pseudoniphargus stocki TaxID=2211535 RepID=A0A345K5T7_9CRUS|nr:cytochrome b [Pseudoniphargus stocki]AXH38229.1 cytochrome b [Pseudoniphargus stocki]
MLSQYYKKTPLFKIMDSTLIQLPAPPNISFLWNTGSLLFICLTIQIISGLLLASSYSASMETSFNLVNIMMETTDKYWFMRCIHANGASLFFICMYAHISRGLYYSSFLFTHTWNAGVTILLLTMAAAFLGYVLPVNQMSFWSASVITNLFSEVPYIGPDIVRLIWGGVSVNSPTIMRFFTFHFFIPFIILMMVIIHITLLHQTGSSNPLGLTSSNEKIIFHPYFSMKDIAGMLMVIALFTYLCLFYPLFLGDNENFTPANTAVTPHHIQPEWYFLFAYAILRSIPNKLGGVIALLLSIFILYLTPFTYSAKFKGFTFYPNNKFMFWSWIWVTILLTWMGACPVEDPYITTGQILTVFYFAYFLTYPLAMSLQDKLMII